MINSRKVSRCNLVIFLDLCFLAELGHYAFAGFESGRFSRCDILDVWLCWTDAYTGCKVIGFDFLKNRNHLFALWNRVGTARVKPTSCWWIYGRRNIAFKHYAY